MDSATHRDLISSWYLRSMADLDTHRGLLRPDGIVAAGCGARFWPRRAAYGRVALPGTPRDAAQICPACRDGIR